MHINLEGNAIATNQTTETSNQGGNIAEDFNEHRSSPRGSGTLTRTTTNSSGKHHQNTAAKRCTSTRGQRRTTRNEHNTVLGKTSPAPEPTEKNSGSTSPEFATSQHKAGNNHRQVS
ncbi:hypothetical protein Taro_056699 [Colocasia esculenta]|uniref:Uncharacterized protein n=1 Tax=Colocasia esculenta TaxID=4460 RepID=A0A843XX79_COLES|nr:hypothetical protein [Colocasia esculenta]